MDPHQTPAVCGTSPKGHLNLELWLELYESETVLSWTAAE